MKQSTRKRWLITICGLVVLLVCASGRDDIMDEGRLLEDDGKNKADDIANKVLGNNDANKGDTVVGETQVKVDNNRKEDTQQQQDGKKAVVEQNNNAVPQNKEEQAAKANEKSPVIDPPVTSASESGKAVSEPQKHSNQQKATQKGNPQPQNSNTNSKPQTVVTNSKTQGAPKSQSPQTSQKHQEPVKSQSPKTDTKVQEPVKQQPSKPNEKHQQPAKQQPSKTDFNPPKPPTPPKPQPPKVEPLPEFSYQIYWPLQNQPYHVYSSMNPRLVLDVANAGDGYHDLILYDWQKSLNQMYYFKRVTKNFYHIVNAQSGEYMKKSQKIIAKTGVSKIKFTKGEGKLWELVPAKQNAKNSFYIKTQEDTALDLNEGYANNGAEIILYEFHKNDNQVWFLRKNTTQFSINQTNKEKYEEKTSQLLYKVMTMPDSINECITLEEMKKEISRKNITLPHWMARPELPQQEKFLLPQEVSDPNIVKVDKTDKVKELQKAKSLTKQQKPSQQIVDEKDSAKTSQQQPLINFKPPKITLQCAKHHTIAYIWYGTKPMPDDYSQLLTKCKDNVKLLTQKDFDFYVQKWNTLNPIYVIDTPDYLIRQRINLLKLLYLYFESGIYADFDTQINEQCFEGIYANEIIWTSRLDENINDAIIFPLEEIVVPEESFMMITAKEHPQVKRMLQEEIMEHNLRGGQRWKECSYRQCLIVQCQRHYRDNTYKKGYD